MLDAGDVDETLQLVTARARGLLDADLAMLVVPDPDDAGSLLVRVADGLAAEGLRIVLTGTAAERDVTGAVAAATRADITAGMTSWIAVTRSRTRAATSRPGSATRPSRFS